MATPTPVYLAGPDIFLPDAVEIGRRKQALCRERGLQGLYPLDGDADPGDPAAIFAANLALMRRAAVGIANLTPFRGPSADAGTVLEVGAMFAMGTPVFGYSGTAEGYAARAAAACGPATRDTAGQRDRDGRLIEDFGLADNLMIVEALRASGGALSAVPAGAGDDDLAAVEAFTACLDRVCTHLGLGAGTSS